ncbi:hypothetical protein [Pseudoxanthomonas suwonensis]
MTPELALDITKFQPINAHAHESGEKADLDASFRDAQLIVRKHINVFAKYFSDRLSGIALSIKTENINFYFKDKDDIALAFNIAVTQQVDDSRSKAVAIATINLMLHDLQYPSTFDQNDDDIAATLMVASFIHGYRLQLAMHFLQTDRDKQAQSIKNNRKYIVGGAILALIATFLWFRLA